VYAAVRRIPEGRVLTYGEVARLVGVRRGARAVGWALRALPRALAARVPWHRVVGRGGRISPRDGAGMAEQTKRLLAEGVRFSKGRVEMKAHGVGPPTRGRAKRSRARRTR
jgi:methylated-DNA-protein-cysteine methyltransferase-like protein